MIPSSPILEIQSDMGMLVLYDPSAVRDRVRAAILTARDELRREHEDVRPVTDARAG